MLECRNNFFAGALAAVAISIAAIPMVVAEELLTPKETLAMEIIELTQADQMLEGMADQMQQQMHRQMESQISCPAEREVAIELTRVFSSELRDLMQSSDLRAELILGYAEIFTRDELEGLVDFYRSDLGKKLIESQPEIAQRTMKVGQRLGLELNAKMQEATKSLRVRMKEVKGSCEHEPAE